MYSEATHGIEASAQNIFIVFRAHSQSVSLNSYVTFHPSGPNFFLSWITAWKKHIPKIIFLQWGPSAAKEFQIHFLKSHVPQKLGKSGCKLIMYQTDKAGRLQMYVQVWIHLVWASEVMSKQSFRFCSITAKLTELSMVFLSLTS